MNRLEAIVLEALTARGWSQAESVQIIGRLAQQGEPGLVPAQRMPWGKYAGQPLNTLPGSYLDWLTRQAWVKEKFGDLYREARFLLGTGV
ncbi:MAG: DUF3820 family protein [Thermodesulfobacteriota bacterium]